MKPLSPHDPFDDLIAAALHGDLSPGERADFETRLQTDPAAHAAYQEALLMHDLLEKTHREAQPDPAFEQRMVSGVRRKLHAEEKPRETAWESVLVLWGMVKAPFGNLWIVRGGYACAVILALTVVLYTLRDTVVTQGVRNNRLQAPAERYPQVSDSVVQSSAPPVASAAKSPPMEQSQQLATSAFADNTDSQTTTTTKAAMAPATTTVAQSPAEPGAFAANVPTDSPTSSVDISMKRSLADAQLTKLQNHLAMPPSLPGGVPATSTPELARKLIRNAQLDLEVKSFQSAVDSIAAMTKAAGGYVDSSNSQRGGNGKIQGAVVVKVLPQNLDSFLLQLRYVGELKNQSVSTNDVTKDYVDTQARLDNSRRMETQLQQLLQHSNGKVADLLEVERELGRVRGEIEQMQGELKLYDFEVEYATVTISVAEKDLDQAAAFLLKERDEFSLFAVDVEATFAKARQAADTFQAHVIEADLNHNSGTDISALLIVSVPPEQIEPFLAQVKSLGRVDNFTRQTERVARNGGDNDQPADETRTDKDRVLVHLTIRADDESRKQVALTVVTPSVEQAFEKSKALALVQPGGEVVSSSFNQAAEGQSTAQLSLRVPAKAYDTVLEQLRALGRDSTFSVQRDDDSAGTGPVVIGLTLTDDETPLQKTELSVLSTDIDAKAQQLKKDAAAGDVEVKASSFERQTDGEEIAQMTFRVTLGDYPQFLDKIEKLGRVESLTVQRDDRPDQARTDENAPAEISLQLHSQGDIVADDNGLWATLRQTFGEGAAALFGSVRTIGVMAAFLAPWLMVLALFAWTGRRIYVARQK